MVVKADYAVIGDLFEVVPAITDGVSRGPPDTGEVGEGGVTDGGGGGGGGGGGAGRAPSHVLDTYKNPIRPA